jgi:flagellum-specific ATP synthase
MLKLNVAAMQQRVQASSGFRTVGRLRSVRDIMTARLSASLGEQCQVRTADGARILGEVIGIDGDHVQLMCFRHPQGLKVGLDVVATGRRQRVPVGRELLGRALDGLGAPIDGLGPLGNRVWRSATDSPPRALDRRPIDAPLVTGQRVIDGLLAIGQGQRVGLFAASGVGKSTLMGEIARSSSADVNVVLLVGERGREVRPFLEESLGPEGMRRSVVIVATSDETSLMRLQAARTALTIAEHFRNQGEHVLFFLDSLTRFAHAQRDMGLARGEMPGARGYPPSVQTALAQILERLGNDAHGSITGIITVLVDGDDHDEPVADAARSILDGHIVMSRKIGARGRYPAIDVLPSISRLFPQITSPEHQRAAQKVRQIMATYAELEDLIQVGAYQAGTSPRVDTAIRMMPLIEQFLHQELGETSPFTQTGQRLQALSAAWNAVA